MHRLFDQRRYLIPFRSTLLPQIFTDTLVIGGGAAGLRAALAAAGEATGNGASPAGHHAEVIVLSKSKPGSTNTAWAQGGIAAVTAAPDSVESHAHDTITAGAGLCDESAVNTIVGAGEEAFDDLMALGARFDEDEEGRPSAGREGGHSASRIFHAGGDATGREIQRALTDAANKHKGIRVFEDCFALDLVTPSEEPGSPVLGAITHHPRHGLQMIWARTVILASGGAGQLFRETTNPRAATADGFAMAYRAGASVADAAFVQFHPTTLYLPGANRALITEAVRGEGAHLLDVSGRRFMTEIHELAELAPRDVVSRSIVRQIAKAGGTHVWLDCRHLQGFQRRFPSIHGLLRRFDLDPTKDLIPVQPAAHYFVGGIRAAVDGETDVPGLRVVGEAACTGLHGANRLASNSLLEGLVCGRRAGEAARKAPEAGSRPPSIVSDIRPSERGEIDLEDVRSSLRSAMWRNVGIERTGSKLESAIEMLDFWGRYTLDKIFDEPEGWETQNLLLTGAIVARSAAWRQETRGCHTRGDYTEAEDEFAVHDCWRRGEEKPAIAEVDRATPTATKPVEASA
ncbi:MAG: L-aspartate oxidase [Planctomycetota bacterium]